MAAHLSEQELRAVRNFIVEAKRAERDGVTGHRSERQVFEDLLKTMPRFEGRLELPRFRYHFRILREEAIRQGKEIADLALPQSDLPTGGALSTTAQVMRARENLLTLYAEEREVRARHEALLEQIRDADEEFQRAMARFNDEFAEMRQDLHLDRPTPAREMSSV
jgi:hypothetical protein